MQVVFIGTTMTTIMFTSYIFIFCVPFVLSDSFNNVVEPACSQDEEICEFSLVLEQRYTMMKYTNQDEEMAPVRADSLWVFSTRTKDCSGTVPIPNLEAKETVVGDGSHKLMLLFNNTFPGPALVVYEGQQVVVKVTNRLINQVTTVHFHGVHQRGTPWMDGTESVSHCGINPKESFTYRFTAWPPGTHWYHSHQGTQRTMGAYGPLIVLPRKILPSQHPKKDQEFIVMVQDLMRKDSVEIFLKATSSALGWSYDFESENCYQTTKQADGFDCGLTPFDSGVINGKGRHYSPETGDVENPFLAVEVFNVQKGGIYKMRIISAAMTFGFRFSIDNHPLHVIAVDGTDVEPREVESLVIFSGERYDVWFEATNPLDVGSYWIRAVTLEREQNQMPIAPGHTEALIHFSGLDEPQTSRRECTKRSPCVILNCPYKLLPREDNSICVPLTDLRTLGKEATLNTEKDKASDQIEELFLNFHFNKLSMGENVWRTTINGIANTLPDTPLQLHRGNLSDIVELCNANLCKDKDICHCTHIINIPLGKVVQLNLATTVKDPTGRRDGTNHPIHIHGYKLQVLKTGWPEYDPYSGLVVGLNQDIQCNDEACNDIQWRNPSWKGGNVPGITNIGAPVKDTVVVPVGGYLVTRFKADNPGYWYLHCHTDFHNLEGMSLVLKVGDDSEMPPPPAGLKSCGSFHWSKGEFKAMSTGEDFDFENLEKGKRNYTQDTTVLVLVFGIVLIVVICVACLLRNKCQKKYVLLSRSDDFTYYNK